MVNWILGLFIIISALAILSKLPSALANNNENIDDDNDTHQTQF